MSVDLARLESHLLSRSYIEGYTPSQADVHVFKSLGSEPSATEYPNSARWYKHIASYNAEHGSLPGTSAAGEAFAKSAAAAPPAAEKPVEDDDEVDLFGSDEEEDAEAERIKAERVKAYQEKKAAKPKTIAKSIVTMDVKPWDDTTDMEELKKNVVAIEKPGLVWGASKLVDIGFGIKKLQITLVVEDELVSIEELQEEIEGDSEHVQSTDVAAMQIIVSALSSPATVVDASDRFPGQDTVTNAPQPQSVPSIVVRFSRGRKSLSTKVHAAHVLNTYLLVVVGLLNCLQVIYAPRPFPITFSPLELLTHPAPALVTTIDPHTHTEPSAAVESQSDATRSIPRSVPRSSLPLPCPPTHISVTTPVLPPTSPSSDASCDSTLSSLSIASIADAAGSSVPTHSTSQRRSRADFEPEHERSDYPEASHSATTAALSSNFESWSGGEQHARKRLRLDDHTSTRPYLHNLTHPSFPSPSKLPSTMRLIETDNNDGTPASFDSDSALSLPNATVVFSSDGQSSPSTAQTIRNGSPYSMRNGNGVVRDVASPTANGRKHSTPPESTGSTSRIVSRVNLAGTRLFDDSCIDREEFVRLVIQSLRDVGYLESAATLETESGYQMESPGVSQFRSYILIGKWPEAENCLSGLGVTDEESLRVARFLISQQKYLELLEVQNVNTALHVLRNELAPLNVDVDELHSLSSLIMCSNADDLRHRAKWDGAGGTSRRTLLSNLQRFISPSTMMPQRRFATVIEQAFNYQRTNCLYHNTPFNPESFSLYTDHHCSREEFPLLTTNILKEHVDEVWNMKWSHDGHYLASASKDKSAFIWLIGPEIEPNVRECSLEKRLRDHNDPVGCLAWSPNDALLLTSTESIIKVWNAKTGICIRELNSHDETVSALEWLPDGSGFLSAGLDRKIILWNSEGNHEDVWMKTTVRVTDLAIAPDLSRIVIVGLECLPVVSMKSTMPQSDSQASSATNPVSQQSPIATTKENRLIIYDYASRTQEASIRLEGELTSVKISQDSRYALINQAPDEVQLWDLDSGRMARKFTGQRQGQHIIRSCFGGVDGNFIVSGSEDGNVYVWHRDTGVLLEVLAGHGAGSVNSVAWNPTNERMFASCSDDWTIRIWESPHAALLNGDSSMPQMPQRVERNNRKGKGRESSGLPGPSSSGVSV